MILVTGASGTVGREVVRALSVAGSSFKAGYSTEDKVARARAAGLDAVLADFSRPSTLEAALSGVERLFLLHASTPEQPALEQAALTAAQSAGVRHVVKLSVWGADEEGFTFARLHRPIERALVESGLAWTILRPNGFMQNIVYMAQTIQADSAIYQPAADAAISHIDVRDIAAVAIQALTAPGHEGRAYLLSGPEALTFQQVAQGLSGFLGRTITYVAVSEEAARTTMLAGGIAPWYADAILDLAGYYRTGGAARVTGDVLRVLGRDPIALDVFLGDHAALLR